MKGKVIRHKSVRQVALCTFQDVLHKLPKMSMCTVWQNVQTGGFLIVLKASQRLLHQSWQLESVTDKPSR